MAPSPVPVLILIVLTLTFQALIFGGELAERSFPSFEEPGDGGGWFQIFDTLGAIIKTIWGVTVFFFNLISFNVPGAPLYIRFIIGTALGGGLIWSIASLIRGN